ncbi:hypothetical protein P153DRAFT_363344 [Dothidotthia symphoricarpi CBS 119687]|uniref:Endoplasmic reticulum junction formation protein lunapark n=1 Tax=Dothidotthia symphoricarpi CBS 119687 TaxID=1392245 RepID=A0A6A6ARH8_9PLEO|nr:uncharacterized protein P153DRAFT_363344 [Dothidotthia symphoricarpi CBS 119687]KAF2133121.1 hypothetical protein P153DRAFT_363344 [Dothidotthia symphoricarpi CBS 119687]
MGWFWKNGTDAAAFERTLSTLSAKISRATTRNDKMRQLSRRARVMWTLYAGFAYILAAMLLTLVTGWQNWGVTEGSVVAGGPVVIYLIRYALTSYFDYRIRNTDVYLKKLNKERDATIDKLKEATKYNSTQQLLEKYGASPKKEPSPGPGRRKSQGPQKPGQPQGPRTGFAPPPTANIQRSPQQPQQQQPSTPQRPPPAVASPQAPPSIQVQAPPEAPGAEFAPNAFGAPDITKQYSSASPSTLTQTHWYDRILDALLGEDETQAKNRMALICSECRLVNGQAPPGTRSIEDVGRWRCGGCRAWNGKERSDELPEDVQANLVKVWAAEAEKERNASTEGGVDSDNRETEDHSSEVDDEEEEEEEVRPLSKSSKGKARARGRK